MNRKLRIFLGAVVALLALLAIIVWLLVSNLDRIVVRVVEDAGSAALGTKVALDGATVSLRDGSAGLRGLSIANPAGFDTPSAFTLGAINAAIDAGNTTRSAVVLDSVIVDNARITFEQKGARNNLKVLLDHLDSSTPSSGEATKEDAVETRVAIKEFRLTGASVTVVQDQLAEPLTLKMPDLVLNNIGRAGAGVTAREAAQQIAKPILDRAQGVAVDRLRDELQDRARDELGRQADRALQQLGDKLLGN